VKKKSKSYRSEYEHYQPNNPLTIYFRKLIEKQPEDEKRIVKVLLQSKKKR